MLQVVKIFIVINLNLASLEAYETKDIFLAKGEQFEIQAKLLKSYSIGNKEVIKALYRRKTAQILVKGKSIGFSDLIIWDQNKKQTYRIYVVSKKEQLGKMQILSALKETSLQVQIKGDFVHIKGIINQLEDYVLVKKLLSQNSEQILANIELETKFKNKIVSLIYTDLYKQGAEQVECQLNFLEIKCFIQDTQRQTRFSHLENKYLVKFEYLREINKHKTYEAQLKFYSIEKIDSNLSNSGFSQLKGSLEELVEHNKAMLETDIFEFQDQKYKYELVAEPTFYIIVNESFNFSLGQEIPIQQTTANTSDTIWKFSGIKINGKVFTKDGRSILQIKSQMTTPTKTGSIQGPKSSTSFIIKPNKYFKLFQIKTTQLTNQDSAVPLLGDIPLLKTLFSKSSYGASNKEIKAFIQLKEINE